MTARPLVACVWVRGHVPYSREYVSRFEGMVRRWLPDCDVVCLTDRPFEMPAGVQGVHIGGPGALPGWWSKVHLFNPAILEAGRRVLYLDLDTLVVAPLAPLLEYSASFALCPHEGRFNGANGRAVVKRFNSSVMVFTSGAHAALYRTWSPAVAARLWGDQDWLGEQLGDVATFPEAWVPRLSSLAGRAPGPDAKVVISKKPKNAEAARRWGWFDAAWGAAPVPVAAGAAS